MYSHNYGSWQVPRSALLNMQTQRNTDLISSLKPVGLKTQEELFPLMSKAEKKHDIPVQSSQAGGVSSYSWEGHHFCSIQAISWLDRVHPHEIGSMVYTACWLKYYSPPETPSQTHPEQLTQYLATSLPSQIDRKLTITCSFGDLSR